MTEEAYREVAVGLSDEEKEDLEKMIKTFREEQSVETPISGAEDVQKQILSMNENLAQFGNMLLKFDSKMKSFYEIIRLSCKKDEMLNQRINAIIEMMKGRINL
jgi:hypothetical protein